MRPHAALYTTCVLLVVIIATGRPVAAQVPQEKPPAEILSEARRILQTDESAPTNNKKYTNFFDPLEMQAFSVALLLGEIQGTSAADNLPDGSKKALADVRDFLPYKSYRLLDTQWIRCCASPTVEGRLRGLDEQYYPFGLVIQGVSGTKMTAHFWLSDAASDAQLSAGKKRMMSSGFSMETGETIVIGTSSLKGDKALVVLLTAVPRSQINKSKKGSVK